MVPMIAAAGSARPSMSAVRTRPVLDRRLKLRELIRRQDLAQLLLVGKALVKQLSLHPVEILIELRRRIGV